MTELAVGHTCPHMGFIIQLPHKLRMQAQQTQLYPFLSGYALRHPGLPAAGATLGRISHL